MENFLLCCWFASSGCRHSTCVLPGSRCIYQRRRERKQKEVQKEGDCTCLFILVPGIEMAWFCSGCPWMSCNSQYTHKMVRLYRFNNGLHPLMFLFFLCSLVSFTVFSYVFSKESFIRSKASLEFNITELLFQGT